MKSKKFRLLPFALLLVVFLVLIWMWRVLPHIAIAEISKLTNTKIAAESVNFNFDGSVFIKKLVVTPLRQTASRVSAGNAILKAESVYAHFSVGSLLLLRPRLKEIRINDFVFDAQLDLDTGRWNLASLKINIPKGGSGGGSSKMPFVRLEEGTFQYSKVSKGQVEVAAAVLVDAKFGLDEETQDGYSFDITTGFPFCNKSQGPQTQKSAFGNPQNGARAKMAGGSGKSSLEGFWKPGRLTVAGGISSKGFPFCASFAKWGPKDIPSFERTWVINTLAAELNYDRDNTYSLKLRIVNCESCIVNRESNHEPQTTSPALPQISQPRRDRVSAGRKGGTSLRPAFLEKSSPFTALQRFFARYRPAGTVDIDLKASGNLGRLSESTLAGKVYCKDVSICDRKFPYPIGQLIGQVDFTENSVVLNKLSGKHGDVDMIIDGWSKNFGANKQYRIQLTSNNMALDNDLYNALSTGQKKLWAAFSPSGSVSAEYYLSRHSQTDKEKTLAIELLGVEATYQHFPYPLKNLTGKLFFDRDSIIVSDVVSQLNGRKISLNGKVTERNTNRPIYYLSIGANNIPLDPTLAAALPAKQRKFYNRFCMTGLADAEVKVFTPEQDSEPTSFTANVFFKDASLKVNKTPLAPPLGGAGLTVSDISAKAVLTADSMSIESFAGRYGQSSVSLVGGIWLSDEAQPYRYHLTVGAKKAKLNDDLIGLLPRSLQKFVSESQPKGNVNLSADLNKAGSDDQLDYKIVVDCLGDSVNFKQFAYPLKDIAGRLTIRNNSIRLENITATPDDNIQTAEADSTIKVNGQIALIDNAFDGGWFELSASDIFLSEQLGAALPEGAADFYQKLSPTGRFDLDLENVKISNSPSPSSNFQEGRGSDDGPCFRRGKLVPAKAGRYIDFAGTAKFKACNFSIPVATPAASRPRLGGQRSESDTEAEDVRLSSVEALNAVLKANGLYKTGSGLFEGQANPALPGNLRKGWANLVADNLKIRGKSLTNLKADINYDRRLQTWLTEELLADFYDGRLIGKLQFKPRPSEGLGEQAWGGSHFAKDRGDPKRTSFLRLGTREMGPGYLLQVGFDNVDLKRFLLGTGLPFCDSLQNGDPTKSAETSPLRRQPRRDRVSAGNAANGKDYTSGTMSGSLSIDARFGEKPSRIGRCRLAISNMQVGKLSPLAKLLQVLKLTEPKDYAFEQMLVDSYIKDNKLFLEKFDLSGQSLAFHGSGWMDLPSENVDLILTARGRGLAPAPSGGAGLAAAEPSVLQSLTEGLSGAVVRMEVTGNVYNPHVKTKTLPVIEDSLKILGTKPTEPKP